MAGYILLFIKKNRVENLYFLDAYEKCLECAIKHIFLKINLFDDTLNITNLIGNKNLSLHCELYKNKDTFPYDRFINIDIYGLLAKFPEIETAIEIHNLNLQGEFMIYNILKNNVNTGPEILFSTINIEKAYEEFKRIKNEAITTNLFSNIIDNSNVYFNVEYLHEDINLSYDISIVQGKLF